MNTTTTTRPAPLVFVVAPPSAEDVIARLAPVTGSTWRALALDHSIPAAVVCTDCEAPAPFRSNIFEAWYECPACGHCMAAMWHETLAEVLDESEMREPCDHGFACACPEDCN